MSRFRNAEDQIAFLRYSLFHVVEPVQYDLDRADCVSDRNPDEVFSIRRHVVLARTQQTLIHRERQRSGCRPRHGRTFWEIINRQFSTPDAIRQRVAFNEFHHQKLLRVRILQTVNDGSIDVAVMLPAWEWANYKPRKRELRRESP